MGKKSAKTGKSRKDKFYELAKESGYRSRAAFKLLQLNRSYHFLEKSRVCIDLCAAPGGWLQVAATHMPMSSIIIGVDLVQIRSIANVITHKEDITTDKCRNALKKDLNDNKADLVLHDGAPNVGKNWLHDAYQQNILVLQSFKLAAEFLKKGGSFITKVFRSKDYYSLMWVFQQFFKKVESTKPQASRNESAEIFVVCQHYLAPDKVDPKFFDIKYVFSDVDTSNESRTALDLYKNDMNQRHRGGYPDGDLTLYHKLTVTDFLNKENFMELLANSNEIELDDAEIGKHPATTAEIKACIKDIRLLGKNEIKLLLKWRLKIKSSANKRKREDEEDDRENNFKSKPHQNVNGTTKKSLSANGAAESTTNGTAEEIDDEQLEDELKDALTAEMKVEKKKQKKILKEKRKIKEKLNMRMEFKDDTISADFHLQGDNEIFSLNKIKTKKQLIELSQALPDLQFSDEDDNEDQNRRKKKISFLKSDRNMGFENDDAFEKEENLRDEMNYSSDDEFDADEGRADSDPHTEDEDEIGDNPLITDLVSKNAAEKKKLNANIWFSKDAFDFLKDNDEENNELLKCMPSKETEMENNKKLQKLQKDDSDFSDDEDEADRIKAAKKVNRKNMNTFEEVPVEKLSAEQMTLGEVMLNSNKVKKQLIDDSFNRYSTFEDNSTLPTWFIEDEDKNCRKVIPLPRSLVQEHKKKFDDINARPIKKVVEAEARKKRRLSKKLDKARKKAENISDNLDMSDKERNREIKGIYKRAGLLSAKKAEIKYVVSKKGSRGRPQGMKGPYKQVDKRLKKDKYNIKKKNRKNKK